MLTPEEQKQYEKSLDKYLTTRWFKKNGFTIYSCIVSTIALIVAIIALFR